MFGRHPLAPPRPHAIKRKQGNEEVSAESSNAAKKQRKSTPQSQASSVDDQDLSNDAVADPGSSGKSKAVAKASKKGKQKAADTERPIWPEYFNELFKIYKALNTVIAFCSSRQQIATTFSVVRTSVERILRKPLELAQVAEIKAILPDLIRFAYTPASQIRVHSDRTSGISSNSKDRAESPDPYEAFSLKSGRSDEQVLVLEFVEKVKLQRPDLDYNPIFSAPLLSPADVKKLIEKRNERFQLAVDELILACQAMETPEDPVALVQKAARDHIPLDPTLPTEQPTPSHNFISTDSRPSIEDVIAEIEGGEEYRDQIVFRKIFDTKEPQYGSSLVVSALSEDPGFNQSVFTVGLTKPLSDSISAGLNLSMSVTKLYSHQAKAINALREGKHVIVSTGTASGKSIIYQVPLLSMLEEDRDTTAMFIFPTKALAQDQKAALEHLLARCPGLEDVKVATYDGDTAMNKRQGIRETASVIFTNFDMIHVSILPHEDTWRRFLKNMKLLVVDELHYYNGTLGCHTAWIMRRLRRVCAALGNRRTQFVSCSATIGQPAIHMKSIFGIEDIEVVTEDGSPAGRKDFLVWSPPLVDQLKANGQRASSLTEACTLFKFLIAKGVKTILFCKIRKTCELAMKTVRAQIAADGRTDLLDRVRAYRGGYSQQDRREIEKQAFSGKLLGIVATNALELGINIGSLDAVVMLGFPFSVASLRQQAGRAGRRLQDSLAVMVADNFPLDQHFVQNPNEIWDSPMADLIVDLDNEVILEGHLQCAADEMPILPKNDEPYFGHNFKALCDKKLIKDKEGWYHTHPNFKPRPSSHVAIRGAQDVKYSIMDITDRDTDGRVVVIEEIEVYRALFEIYEGGIFMHQGDTYLVNEVSHDERCARVVKTDVSWLTTPRDYTDIDPVETSRIRAIRGSPHRAYFGKITVKTVVFGFFKVRNNSILDSVDLDTPPFERETVGMWINVPSSVLDLMRRKGLSPAEAIHAAEHTVLNMSPLYAFATDGDIKTECKIPEKEYAAKESNRKRPARLIFYDGSGKCTGVSAKAFDHTSDLLLQALERLEACQCETGCPSCIEAANCRSGYLVTNKLGAKLVLQSILDLPIDEDAIPDADPEVAFNMPETVVEATSVKARTKIEVEDLEDVQVENEAGQALHPDGAALTRTLRIR
ncbi:hypothetical protein FRC01_005168 [Tulasnella sp. 417]|nr:hypothetical protein FRC01_005168 [Tulasnella sp. 417]